MHLVENSSEFDDMMVSKKLAFMDNLAEAQKTMYDALLNSSTIPVQNKCPSKSNKKVRETFTAIEAKLLEKNIKLNEAAKKKFLEFNVTKSEPNEIENESGFLKELKNLKTSFYNTNKDTAHKYFEKIQKSYIFEKNLKQSKRDQFIRKIELEHETKLLESEHRLKWNKFEAENKKYGESFEKKTHELDDVLKDFKNKIADMNKDAENCIAEVNESIVQMKTQRKLEKVQKKVQKKRDHFSATEAPIFDVNIKIAMINSNLSAADIIKMCFHNKDMVEDSTIHNYIKQMALSAKQNFDECEILELDFTLGVVDMFTYSPLHARIRKALVQKYIDNPNTLEWASCINFNI